MSIVKWNATKEEHKIIAKIADRVFKYEEENGLEHYDRLDLMMDLEAVHSNDDPIDFQMLLDYDDFEFAHDIFGIRNCIDRNTGKLMKCFVPRASRNTQYAKIKGSS